MLGIGSKDLERPGNLEEIELTTPAGHLEGLTLRLYDPPSAPMEALLGKCESGRG